MPRWLVVSADVSSRLFPIRVCGLPPIVGIFLSGVGEVLRYGLLVVFFGFLVPRGGRGQACLVIPPVAEPVRRVGPQYFLKTSKLVECGREVRKRVSATRQCGC